MHVISNNKQCEFILHIISHSLSGHQFEKINVYYSVYESPSPGRGKGPLYVLVLKKVTTLYDVIWLCILDFSTVLGHLELLYLWNPLKKLVTLVKLVYNSPWTWLLGKNWIQLKYLKSGNREIQFQIFFKYWSDLSNVCFGAITDKFNECDKFFQGISQIQKL